ncbi:hypothetical protein SKAU_G00055490, partial [Synaphobranchus kaupii]
MRRTSEGTLASPVTALRGKPTAVWTRTWDNIGRRRRMVRTPRESIQLLRMQGEERKRRKLSMSSKGTSDEYCLRERPREDEAKMKNKLSSSHVNSKKKPWSWDQYLEDEKAIAAPARLFTEWQYFPNNRNGYKVGMLLEGIDPLHPSMFCVLSVAEVIGYRLRLHIDGYSECYDFWVNADSPDIKPAVWCEMMGHKLQPPKGYKEHEFNWAKYQEACNAQAAPKNLFKTQNSTVTTSKFQVGMKLEAVDRKNPCLVCVATVADIVDNRFLVHFDNWDDTYDYWCDATSPHIHPVGWCQDHGRPLTAPQGHPNPENFLWEEYLEDTGSSVVPSQAFCVRAPHRFQVNMKLEAVDRRNPMLIRVATVVDTEDYRVKVHFDGWHEKFDFWVDSDLPDLHPSGWCTRTGHPLEPPPRSSDPKNPAAPGICPTPGCRGVGHIKGARYTGHHRAMLSGYEGASRLRGRYASNPRPPGYALVKREHRDQPYAQEHKPPAPHGKRGRPPGRLSQSTKYLKIKEEEEEIDLQSVFKAERCVDSMQQALHQSVFLSAMSAHPSRDLPLCWEQHCKLLPGVEGVQASRVAHWTVEE